MRSRTVDTTLYTLTYNAINKLHSVSGGATVSYIYDADGNLAKKVVNGVTTTYVGNHYEKTGSVITKYYYLGGRRVAMREGNTRYFIQGDHLGSASLVTTATAGVHSQRRYPAYGETRSSDTLPTDRRFTGQRWETATGLYDYNARYYDPALGRFVQADTLVPDPGNPQALNRYAYVYNNPLRYTDPSGHCADDDTVCQELANNLYEQYGWRVHGIWSWSDVWTLWQAAGRIELWFAENGGNGRARMRGTLSEVTFKHAGRLWELSGFSHVEGHTVFLTRAFSSDLVVHELGHVFDNSFGTEWAAIFGGGPADDMAKHLGGFPDHCITRFNCNLVGRSSGHYGGYRSWNTPGEPHTGKPYDRMGPAEDFAQTFERQIAQRSSGGFVQRAQWLRSFTALQIEIAPTYTNLPYQLPSAVG